MYQIYCESEDTETNFSLTLYDDDDSRKESKTLLMSGFVMEKVDMSLADWMDKCDRARMCQLQVKQFFLQVCFVK